MENSAKTQEIGSAFDLLSKSFNLVKKNWPAFLFVNILSIFAALGGIASNNTSTATKDHGNLVDSGVSQLSGLQIGTIVSLSIAFVVLFLLIYVYFLIMQVTLQTRVSGGESPNIGQIVKDTNSKLSSLVLLYFLSALMVIGGLILFIVPGILILSRIILAPYAMIDKNLGVKDSLKESRRLYNKFPGKVWGAIGVVLLINILVSILQSAVPVLGQLAGVILSITFCLVLALRYFQLKNADSGKSGSDEHLKSPASVPTPPQVPTPPAV
jgi:hypothetical protein